VFAKESLPPARKRILWINGVGGVAVLGSYVHGLATHPDLTEAIWGGVPEAIRPLYTVNMFLAAAGYLLFTGVLLFRVDPAADRAVSRVDFRRWQALYLAVLVPSALWMPLTFAMLESPSAAWWFAIRAALWTVGIASLGFVIAFVRLRDPGVGRLRWLAIGGAIAFSLQTAVLDALVWVAYFPA
jgi:hypothetical protein